MWAHHAHAVWGQPQRCRDGVAIDVYAASGLPDGQVGVCVLTPRRQSRARLQRRGRVSRYLEVVLQHHVRFGEPFCDAAPLQGQYLAQSQIPALVDGDGVRVERGLGAVVVGQNGILDANQSQRRPSRVWVVGCHRRHLVAHESDARVEDGSVWSEAPGRDIEWRDYGVDAGQGQGL